MRWLAILLLVITTQVHAGNFGDIGGGIGRIIIYSHSMSDAGAPESCEWCDPLTDAGLQVWNVSWPASQMDDDNSFAGFNCSTVDTPFYKGCYFYGERQIALHDSVTDEACTTPSATCACRRTATNQEGEAGGPVYFNEDTGTSVGRYVNDTAKSSCAADTPTSSQDVDVIFFVTNDVSKSPLYLSGSGAGNWQDNKKAAQLVAFNLMLDAVEAANHACVVVLAPPAFRLLDSAGNNFWEASEPATNDLNTAMAVEVAANRPSCRVANVEALWRSVEKSLGVDAMYRLYLDCDDNAGVYGPVAAHNRLPRSDPNPPDCTHPWDGPTAEGLRPNDMMGAVILQAIQAAHYGHTNN